METREQQRVKKILELLVGVYPGRGTALEHKNTFQLLIATILSAQSTDKQVNRVTNALFQKYTVPEELANADPAELENDIKECGLYRSKSHNLKKMAQQLKNKHNGVVPGDFEALIGLAGVGRKTANVVLSNAFGVPALAVDTHVFRVSRRLGLSYANSAHQVEKELCHKIPRSLWSQAHNSLIAHGRATCRARFPDCSSCILLSYCPTEQQLSGAKQKEEKRIASN